MFCGCTTVKATTAKPHELPISEPPTLLGGIRRQKGFEHEQENAKSTPHARNGTGLVRRERLPDCGEEGLHVAFDSAGALEHVDHSVTRRPKLQKGKGFDFTQDLPEWSEQFADLEDDDLYTQEQCEFLTENEEESLLEEDQPPQRAARGSLFGCGAPEMATPRPRVAFRRAIEPELWRGNRHIAKTAQTAQTHFGHWGWEIFG